MPQIPGFPAFKVTESHSGSHAMARRSEGPWWNEQKQTYCVQVNGKRHTLSRDYAEAEREYRRLLTGASGKPFGEVLDEYLASRPHDVKTRLAQRSAAKRFESILSLDTSSLTADDIRRCAERAEFAPSTRRSTYALARAALNYAARRGVTSRVEWDTVRMPHAESRGERAIISPETHSALLAASPPWLSDALTALHDTGCRPSELCRVTAKDLDRKRGAWVLRKHKTAEKCRRPRVIYLTPLVRARSEELAAIYPEGPLYRGFDGRPLTPDAIGSKVAKLCERHGLPPVIPYGYRHTFATRALLADVPVAKVAALLGHSNTITLFLHYAHLLSDDENMRAALAKFSSIGSST